MKLNSLLRKLKVNLKPYQGKDLVVTTPITGEKICTLKTASPNQVNQSVKKARKAFEEWQKVPMPVRGRLVRMYGEVLRQNKQALGELVSLECGKSLTEGLGEVQEMIDMCNLTVGLSRQIGGTIFSSELDDHNLQETWHPKGVVGIITAFNFPVAVWAWNFAISVVCGNSNIWKPSEKTPVCAIACQQLFDRATKQFTKITGHKVPAISQIIIGDATAGQALVSNTDVNLVSATGSCRLGDAVRQEVAKTLGRNSLLELGGNNAVIITPNANMELAIPSTLFGAIGTAGQRCTTTRRLFIHQSQYKAVLKVLTDAYQAIGKNSVGNPLDAKSLVGPLIDKTAFDHMQKALQQAKKEGGKITGGHRVLEKKYPNASYVAPALVAINKQTKIVMEETFAPILYVIPYKTLAEAIKLNNSVEQGLSSAIFTQDIREAEIFLRDTDTGIANVNNGTSGAELGGAFGGNKSTGSGREAGSDAWKSYMTRATNRINYSAGGLKLAQGVKFPVKLNLKSIK